MNYLKSTFFALCVILIFTEANAQKTMSLTDCINYAHANSLQIRQAQLDADVASNNYFESKMQILPDLNASISRNYNYGFQTDSYTNDFINDNTVTDSYYISSSINLFNGLQTYNSIKANEFYSLSKIQEVEQEKVNLTLQVASAYLSILFNQELVEVAKSQRDITSLQVERTSKLVDAGSTARGDLLEMKAQHAAENLNVTNAVNELGLAYLNLTQMLDLDSVGGFEIYKPENIDPDFTSEIDNVLTVYQDAISYLPHIKTAESMVLYNQKYLEIQKGQLSPSLSLTGSWSTGYTDYAINPETQNVYAFRDQIDLLSSKSLYFSLSIPIFNKWAVKTDISNAQIGLIKSETTLEQTKKQLYKEIQQAHNDASSAGVRFQSANEAVDSYREAFTYTEQKFNVGIVNTVEYNIAKNNFIKAQSDLLQSKYEYLFSVKILDFYRGVPISL